MENPGKIRNVGLAQRLLLWAALASILSFIITPGLVVAIPFQLYCIYKLSKALELHTVAIVFLMLAMVIPLVSTICLLVLNGKATSVLKSAGIKVGLMGAKASDLPSVEN